MLAVDTDAFVRTYNSRAYIFIYGKVLYACLLYTSILISPEIPAFMLKNLLEVPASTAEASTPAVSYTHLDVYKRQSLYIYLWEGVVCFYSRK